jgi:hypothetical protein
MSTHIRRRVDSRKHPRFPGRKIPAGSPLPRTHQYEMMNAEARVRSPRTRAPKVRFRLPVRAGPMDHPLTSSTKGDPSVPIVRKQTFTGKDGSPSAHSDRAESEVSHG